MKYYVGIDLGGTNIQVGVVNQEYAIIHKDSVKTQSYRGAQAVIKDMASLTKQVLQQIDIDQQDIEWVGVGSPGAVNPQTGTVEYSNNLEWDYFPLVECLQAELGLPVLIANDANAAAFGEYMAGSGKNLRTRKKIQSLVAITLGTGVGGGVIQEGKILTGFNYAGGELGHMAIVANGKPCTCGRLGCWEAYASATGLVGMTKEAMNKNSQSSMWTVVHGDLEAVDGKTAFDAMRVGDASGKKVVCEYIKYLGVGMVNIVNIFQPEIICLSGGIAKEGETLLEPLRTYVHAQNFVRDPKKQTKIVAASLGNDAGVIGAALLGQEKGLND